MCKWAHNFLSDLLLFGEYILSFENISFDLNCKLQADLTKRSPEAVLSCIKRHGQNTCSTELSVRLSEQVAFSWRQNSYTETSVVICISAFGHHGKNIMQGLRFCYFSGSANSLFFIFHVQWALNSKLAHLPHFAYKKTEIKGGKIIFPKLHIERLAEPS